MCPSDQNAESLGAKAEVEFEVETEADVPKPKRRIGFPIAEFPPGSVEAAIEAAAVNLAGRRTPDSARASSSDKPFKGLAAYRRF